MSEWGFNYSVRAISTSSGGQIPLVEAGNHRSLLMKDWVIGSLGRWDLNHHITCKPLTPCFSPKCNFPAAITNFAAALAKSCNH